MILRKKNALYFEKICPSVNFPTIQLKTDWPRIEPGPPQTNAGVEVYNQLTLTINIQFLQHRSTHYSPIRTANRWNMRNKYYMDKQLGFKGPINKYVQRNAGEKQGWWERIRVPVKKSLGLLARADSRKSSTPSQKDWLSVAKRLALVSKG